MPRPTKIVNGMRREMTNEEIAENTAHAVAQARPEARRQAIERTKAHLVGLVEGDFNDFTGEDLRALQWIHASLVPAARSDELKLAAQRYAYARTKIGEILTMTTQQANNYDPATDTSWPEPVV